MKSHNQKQKRTQSREDAKATQRKPLLVFLRGSASLCESFFRLPLLLWICLVLTHAACKMDINDPVEAPNGFWDASLNTHPKGAAFQKLLNDYVKRGLPGLVMFVKSPEGIWNGAAGYARLETRERMTPMHLHHSASIAKTYTATAVMMLVDEGKIAVDAKINTYLPGKITDKIGNGNEATVRHLLNHTSGIRDWQNDEIISDLDFFNDPYGVYTPETLLAYISGKPAYFPAGSQYDYSNTNYLLLTLIMDHVLGESHANFVSKRIIKHLGLENTYYKNEPGYPRPPGLVNSYEDQFGNGSLMNITDLVIQSAKRYWGQAGYIASSYDYARFIEALFNGELVSDASLQEMMPGANFPSYGFGMFLRITPYGRGIGHDGGDPGTQTHRLYFPDSKTTLVLLTNAGNQGKPEKLFFGSLIDDAIKTIFQ